MPFLPPNQQRQSTEGNNTEDNYLLTLLTYSLSIIQTLTAAVSDTIQNSVLTCAQKLTLVSLIYRKEPKKTVEKTKEWLSDMLTVRGNGKVLI